MTTEKGLFRAAVPSGASTGENEACELRDGGSDYMGKGRAAQRLKEKRKEKEKCSEKCSKDVLKCSKGGEKF